MAEKIIIGYHTWGQVALRDEETGRISQGYLKVDGRGVVHVEEGFVPPLKFVSLKTPVDKEEPQQ